MESNSAVDFLNRELFEKALKSYKYDDTIQVIKFELFEAFGEHYGSKMYRAKIEFKSKKFESQTLDVVIKISPPGNPMEATSRKMFQTEIEMYKNVLPAFSELFQRSGQNIEFAPE